MAQILGLVVVLESCQRPRFTQSLPLWASVKFMFSKNATKIDEIFTVDLTLCTKCQIDDGDFVYFCDLFRKYDLLV